MATDPQSLAYGAVLAQARAALAQGDFARAAQIADRVARADPKSAEACFVMAMALAETGHVVHALGQVRRAAMLAPANAEYAAQHARLLVMMHRDDDARQVLDHACALPSDDPLVLDTIGCVLARLGDHRGALPLFKRAVAAQPDTLSFRFNYASSLGFFGRVDAAAVEYEAIVARDPTHGAAHLGLAGLARQTLEHNHIVRIEAALAITRNHADAVRLHYAAAKEHEDLGASAAVFAHLDTANRAHRVQIGYDPGTDAARCDALRAAFAQADYFTGTGLDDVAPIFVVGLPRTGTTLVDRIIGAHRDVHALGELQAMPLAVKRLSQSPSHLVLDDATIAGMAGVAPKNVAQAYLAQARAQVGATHSLAQGIRIADKFPLNFLYIGYILRAFPRARIVCLRRDPLDSVWSNYKHLFALNSPYYGYSYDLVDAARYYALFDGLMAFWRMRFPAQIMELEYEALVSDQDRQTRALLAHCGLDWDEACLNFHEATGAVATPSAQQVRRKLNRDSVGRWRAYRAQMAPVVNFFREQGIVMERSA